MTTETVYTDNIASIISPACANIRDMFIDLAGDYSEEYDTDKAARDYAEWYPWRSLDGQGGGGR